MPRKISEIAADIQANWPKPYFGAEPYIRAMALLKSPHDAFGLDSAASILRYFLANAQTWRGPDARRVKAEIKQLLKESSR